jgi:hypothetical protein
MNLRDFNTSRCSQGPSRACHSVARARSLGPAGCRTRQPTSTPERGWWSPSGFGARHGCARGSRFLADAAGP